MAASGRGAGLEAKSGLPLKRRNLVKSFTLPGTKNSVSFIALIRCRDFPGWKIQESDNNDNKL
jgi:hypothetical protein